MIILRKQRNQIHMRNKICALATALISFCISAFGTPVPGVTTEDASKLYGLVHWDGMKSTNKGLAILPTDISEWTGQLDYQWKISSYPYNYGGCHFEDRYFCNFLRTRDGYILEQKAYIINDQTGEEIETIQVPTAFDLFDGAYYEPENVIYGFIRDISTEKYGWAKVNPRTAQIEMVKVYPDLRLYGVAVTEDGRAYGISGDGEVYSIDRTTGNTTLLFKNENLETKTVPKAHTGAAWDEENKRIVFAVCNLEKDGGSRLFNVDISKKSVSLIYKLDGMGTQLAGLYFEQTVNPGAPGVATDLAVDFKPGSLSGEFRFTLPSVSFDGTEMQGNVDYLVKIDGENAIEKSGKYGETISLPVNIDKAGYHSFYVRCSNDNGKGHSAKLEKFVGFDSPLAPTQVSARYYGGKMHLAWTPSPATGAKGGPVNTDSIIYIIRSNHNETFETEAGATSYEYNLPVPEKFTPWYFTVTAHNSDGESLPTSSNNVPLNAFKGNYSQDFTSESSKYDFTTLDSNNDGKTWEWGEEGLMVIRYNEQIPMDDYLTLPPIDMEYGEYYVLEFDAGVFNFDEVIEVKLAEDYNQQGIDSGEVIYGPMTLEAEEGRKVTWSHHDLVMKAPDDNRFFLSLHGLSPADRNVIFIDNIAVRKLAGATVPAAITDLKAIPDSKGKLSVTISGTLPTLDVAGNPVSSVDYVKVMRDGNILATVTLSGNRSFEWTDNNAARGENNYVIIPGNSTGDGLASRCRAHTGFVTPLAPENCNIRYQGSGYNAVEFSWSPVTRDLNGLDVSESVRYDVIRSLEGEMSFRSQSQKQTTYTDNFKGLKSAQYVQYGAYALVDGMESEMIVSPQIPVGPACSMPLTEGFFPEINMAYGLDKELTSDKSGLFTTKDTDKYQSADNDGGYGIFIGNNAGESATLYTAWISIPQNAVEPVASIQYYGEGDAIANLIHMGVSTDIANGFVLEKSIETGGMGWQTATVNLDQYRGCDIRIALKFETVRNTYLRFDDFRVCDLKVPEGIDATVTDNFRISTGKGILSIKGCHDAEVSIYSVDGLKIYVGTGDVSLNLKTGVYVINVGNESFKVSMR